MKWPIQKSKCQFSPWSWRLPAVRLPTRKPNEALGQPAPGVEQSLSDLEAQVAYQRAFEATLWAMPASAIYRFRVALLAQPGMADNVITAYSGPLHTIHELITPNQVTPYIGAICRPS